MLPTNRPLRLSDFASVQKGATFILYYKDTNEGDMTFIFDHVGTENGQPCLCGRYGYIGEPFEDEVRGYLYQPEDYDYICYGSGAEPVWACEPPYRGRPGEEEYDEE